VQTARQGLGKSQSQGARVSASRLHQAHVEKAMQSRMISPDRLLEHFSFGLNRILRRRIPKRAELSESSASDSRRLAMTKALSNDLRERVTCCAVHSKRRCRPPCLTPQPQRASRRAQAQGRIGCASPLPWGEVGARSAPGEGLRPIESHLPPLPKGRGSPPHSWRRPGVTPPLLCAEHMPPSIAPPPRRASPCSTMLGSED
jgi:hypothetical protein